MPSAVSLVIAIIAVALFVLVAMVLRGSHRRSLDREAYQTRWLKIENSLTRNNPQSYPLAIIEADKLLDRALVELGISGKTLGERLKKIGTRFSDVDQLWFAHKIRNRLAHETDYAVDYNTANRALRAFRQALKDLGAI